MVTWTVEEVSAVGWVEIEEDARDDDYSFFETGFKEGESVVDSIWQIGH